MLEQLLQLIIVTWDGNLISKSHRDALVKQGFVMHVRGFNFITKKGIEWLASLDLIKR